MSNQSFTTSFLVDQSPQQVFDAITNVRGWWSEELQGESAKLNDVFDYKYHDVHSSKMKLVEVIPGKRIVWEVLDNHFSFTEDKTEWIGTKAIFDISRENGQTKLTFMHDGLVPTYECFSACVNGWTQYINTSLYQLITTGQGQPNAKEKHNTTHEVAFRFNELAQQEKWFEIQDELFENDVKSIEPEDSPYLKNAQGKSEVRKKAEAWVSRITGLHHAHTTTPVIAGNHFAVGREMDITVNEIGRIQIKQLMVYEVKNGKIISEEFFY